MSNEKVIWNGLRSSGYNEYATAGIMGNLQAESGMEPQNLQDTYNRSIGLSDTAYTTAVDRGTYGNFVRDAGGYGIAQWTYYTRKQSLLNYAKSKGTSIGDLGMQIEFLVKELKEDYPSIHRRLLTIKSVEEASDIILLEFERPANSQNLKSYRAGIGQKFYDMYAGNVVSSKIQPSTPNTSNSSSSSIPLLVQYGDKNYKVKAAQVLLVGKGYSCGSAGPDGEFGSGTLAAVKKYQKDKGLSVDGKIGKETWTSLFS